MSDIGDQIERGGAGPEWQASHRTHYQVHPDLVDEVNALRAELADVTERQDRLRQMLSMLECRIAQQRRELARLSWLVTNQRAAMAAEGIDYAAAEQLALAWSEAKHWHDAWKAIREPEHGRQANDGRGRDATNGQPGGSQDPRGR